MSGKKRSQDERKQHSPSATYRTVLRLSIFCGCRYEHSRVRNSLVIYLQLQKRCYPQEQCLREPSALIPLVFSYDMIDETWYLSHLAQFLVQA